LMMAMTIFMWFLSPSGAGDKELPPDLLIGLHAREIAPAGESGAL
jgi:hypothetical protein